MKLKILGLAALSMALMALAAGSASATTLEVGGVTQNSSVSLSAHLESKTILVQSRTDGSLMNECEVSTMEGKSSSPFTGTSVTTALTELTFSSCDYTVHVHRAGQLYVKHISGTTNATMYSENAEMTFSTAFGYTVNCKTGEGTDLGKLTGVSSGNATIDIDAVVNCGFLLPSATWKGSYEVTSALGVSA